MLGLVIAFLLSLVTTTLVIRYDHVHRRWTGDHDTDGVQKMHAESVPRVGGIGIGVGVLGALVAMWLMHDPLVWPLFVLFLCGLPAYLGGLVEDLTKRVSALNRLILTMAAAVLSYYFLNARLNHVDIAWIDAALTWWPLALLLTAFAVGGVANAVNIIDGYNGLSGVVVCVMLGGLVYVAIQVNDVLVLRACLVMIGAVMGFLIWNWPWGRIFLGDGGAYLLGFWVAVVSLILLARNPQVSPWFPLMLIAYPVVETLFSIYRRLVIRKSSPGMPDAVHLHQLIFRRLIRWSAGSEAAKSLKLRNSMTAPYLWAISSVSVVLAILLWKYTLALQIAFFAFAAAYVWMYTSLVRFKARKWMITRMSK